MLALDLMVQMYKEESGSATTVDIKSVMAFRVVRLAIAIAVALMNIYGTLINNGVLNLSYTHQ